jgi:hypothetical protein
MAHSEGRKGKRREGKAQAEGSDRRRSVRGAGEERDLYKSEHGMVLFFICTKLLVTGCWPCEIRLKPRLCAISQGWLLVLILTNNE